MVAQLTNSCHFFFFSLLRGYKKGRIVCLTSFGQTNKKICGESKVVSVVQWYKLDSRLRHEMVLIEKGRAQ